MLPDGNEKPSPDSRRGFFGLTGPTGRMANVGGYFTNTTFFMLVNVRIASVVAEGTDCAVMR